MSLLATDNYQFKGFFYFLETYGWAILSSIIAIGILWYLGVFSSPTQNYDMNCVKKSFCESQSLKYQNDGWQSDIIICRKYITQNISQRMEFQLDKLENIQNDYPQCMKTNRTTK
jgi:hypothetical protein